MKRCTKCHKTKSFSEFRKDKSGKDGHRSQCKACQNLLQKEYVRPEESRQKDVARHREKRLQRQAQLEAEKARVEAIKAKRRAEDIEYKAKYPERILARRAVALAVKEGILARAATLICPCRKAAKSYHHHKGYDKVNWLNVVALCNQCHEEADKQQVLDGQAMGGRGSL